MSRYVSRVSCISCVSWSLLALATTGCRPARQSPLDADTQQYVRLAVALGERDSASLDFYAGPSELVADVRRDPPPLATIGRDAATLAGRLRSYHFPDPVEQQRVGGLLRSLGALAARVDLLTGTRLPYNEESLVFFGVAPAPVDESRLDSVRSRIAAAIGGTGRLVDRYTAFASRFIISADRLQPVMAAALDACRQATLPHVELPAGESATIEFVRNKPWGAFSRYLGNGRSQIQINRDFQFTVDQALQIACHEGYPGHHARNAIRAASGAASRRPERLVQLTFSPE